MIICRFLLQKIRAVTLIWANKMTEIYLNNNAINWNQTKVKAVNKQTIKSWNLWTLKLRVNYTNDRYGLG